MGVYLITLNLDYIEGYTRIVKYNLFGFCTKSHFTIRMLNMLYINKFGCEISFTAEKDSPSWAPSLHLKKLYNKS